MPTLKLGNSYSQIEGLTVEQYRALKAKMTYAVNPEATFTGGRVRYISLLDKQLRFPTGLLYIVQEAFPGILTIDTRVRPITPLDAPRTLFQPGAAPTPYFHQKEGISALMSAGGRGLVSSPTGSGKSLMIAMAIDAFKVRTLVVVPGIELRRQLTESLVTWFGKRNFDKFVTVANIDSLDPNKPLLGYGAVIVEEVHRSAAKSYRDLNKKAWNDVYYRAGFSATPYRNDDNELLLFESFLSSIVYRVTYHEAVENGYIVPVEAYYLKIPKISLTGNVRHYGAMYSENIVSNEARNTRIAVVMSRLHSQGKSTLCLVREIKHGQILSEKTHFPFANGQDGQSRDLIRAFNSGELRTLIGTVGVLGEGIDSRPAEWVIIAGAGKAKTQLLQNIGRGVRKYPGKESCKVLLIADSSHQYFRSHFRDQCKIIREEYGVEPVEIDL